MLTTSGSVPICYSCISICLIYSCELLRVAPGKSSPAMGAPDEGDDSLEKQFSQTTSCHGFVQVSNNDIKAVRGIWMLVMLVALGLLLYQATILTTRYLKYEAVSQVIVRKNDTMDFPAVTICNYNRFLKYRLQNVAERYGVSSDALWTFLSAMFRADDLVDYNSIEFLLNNISDNLNQSSSGRPNLRQLIIDSSATLEDLFPSWFTSCRWYGDYSADCRQLFVTVITSNGVCFTFNSLVEHSKEKQPRKQIYSGRRKGLFVTANLSLDQHTEHYSHEGLGSSEEGMFVAVHSPWDKADMDIHSQVVIPPGRYAYIVIKVTKVENTEEPYGNCRTRRLQNYLLYSQTSCYNDFLTHLINRTCGCLPVYRPILDEQYTTPCPPQQVQTCVIKTDAYFNEDAHYPDAAKQYSLMLKQREIESLESYCRPACQADIYDLSVSYAEFPNKHTAMWLKKRMAPWNLSDIEVDQRLNSLTSFDINFQNMKYIESTQKPGRRFEDLLADVGGQMGLFLGVSILTMAEFIEYFIKKCYHLWPVKYKNQKKNAVQS